MDDDERRVRRAIELATESAQRGDGPYGALVVRGDDVLAEAGNTVATDGLSTRHAEINAIEAAQRRLGSRDLAGCTLVTSAEPCPMCAGAAHWAGLERIVYGASVPRIRAEGRHGSRQLTVRCVEVVAGGGVDVVGPVCEDEAIALHR